MLPTRSLRWRLLLKLWWPLQDATTGRQKKTFSLAAACTVQQLSTCADGAVVSASYTMTAAGGTLGK